MATANYEPTLVAIYAKLRAEILEEEKSEAKRVAISEYMLEDLTFGHLWWKTTRRAYREEAEFLYDKGYWPHDKDPYRVFSWPLRLTHQETFDPGIRQARRILEMCRVSPPPSHITLDDQEVRFLRLPTQEEAA
jgi:hypothetical protein